MIYVFQLFDICMQIANDIICFMTYCNSHQRQSVKTLRFDALPPRVSNFVLQGPDSQQRTDVSLKDRGPLVISKHNDGHYKIPEIIFMNMVLTVVTEFFEGGLKTHEEQKKIGSFCYLMTKNLRPYST